MKAKHTPGPWPVITGPIKVESSSYIVAIQADNPHVNIKVHGTNKKTCAANARLIAAAPDLLNVCLQLLKAEAMQNGERNGYVMGAIGTAIDQAREAIKKATGDERDA